jgi:hypothetical protein
MQIEIVFKTRKAINCAINKNTIFLKTYIFYFFFLYFIASEKFRRKSYKTNKLLINFTIQVDFNFSI